MIHIEEQKKESNTLNVIKKCFLNELKKLKDKVFEHYIQICY